MVGDPFTDNKCLCSATDDGLQEVHPDCPLHEIPESQEGIPPATKQPRIADQVRCAGCDTWTHIGDLMPASAHPEAEAVCWKCLYESMEADLGKMKDAAYKWETATIEARAERDRYKAEAEKRTLTAADLADKLTKERLTFLARVKENSDADLKLLEDSVKRITTLEANFNTQRDLYEKSVARYEALEAALREVHPANHEGCSFCKICMLIVGTPTEDLDTEGCKAFEDRPLDTMKYAYKLKTLKAALREAELRATCAKCRALTQTEHPQCVYCGKKLPSEKISCPLCVHTTLPEDPDTEETPDD